MAWYWRPQLACRTAALHWRREASRWCDALRWSYRPATINAARRVRIKLERCASSSEIASAGKLAPRSTRRWPGIGDCSWHIAFRPHAEREGPSAGAAPFRRAYVNHNQLCTTHACSKLDRFACSSESASGGAPVPRDTRRWLGIGDRRRHVPPRPHAEGERPFVDAPQSNRAQIDRNQRGTVHARSQLKYCASSPKETASGPQPALRVARAASSSVAPPPQRYQAPERMRRLTRGVGLVMEAATATSHRHLTPEERVLSSVRCHFVNYRCGALSQDPS